MRASNTLIERIKKFESFLPTAYWDATGKVWTIGYGHTGGVKKGERITQSQAVEYLRQDLAIAEKKANATRGIRTQGQFDAVVDFCYNCGTGNFDKSTLKKYIEAGRKTYEIQKEFMKWTKSGGIELGGLYTRRLWEANRWTE